MEKITDYTEVIVGGDNYNKKVTTSCVGLNNSTVEKISKALGENSDNHNDFSQAIVPMRDNLDDALIGCFGKKVTNYDKEVNWDLLKTENNELVEMYTHNMSRLISKELGRALTELEENILTNRLIQVALVAKLKKKHNQESVQNGRKEEVRQKYINNLGELGQNIYDNIIHKLSVDMEDEIKNRR